MDKPAFKFKELCHIIETGGMSGVAELKFGDICIKYHTPDAASGIQIIKRHEQASLDPSTQQEEQKVFDEQTQEIVQHFINEQMLVEDPYAHEQYMADELMRSRQAHDEAEED